MKLRDLLWIPLALLLACCDGYTDLPLPVRENAALMTDGLSLYPDALGVIQLSANLPEDVTEPLFVVSPPYVREVIPVSVNWARGACPTLQVSPPSDSAYTVCLSLYAPGGFYPGGFTIDMVLEERATGRRFNMVAEVADTP